LATDWRVYCLLISPAGYEYDAAIFMLLRRFSLSCLRFVRVLCPLRGGSSRQMSADVILRMSLILSLYISSHLALSCSHFFESRKFRTALRLCFYFAAFSSNDDYDFYLLLRWHDSTPRQGCDDYDLKMELELVFRFTRLG